MKKYNVAILGATGLVGQTMIKVLEESSIDVENLYVFASSRSVGLNVIFRDKTYSIIELKEEAFNMELDFAFFAIDSELSKHYGPFLASKGVYVIDNSSQWRMDPNVPLIVPEINGHILTEDNYLIANPNCSTIQSVVPLKVIDKLFNVKSVSYSSYQAVSGSGTPGVNDLKRGEQGFPPEFYPKQIYSNVIPQIDSFLDSGYTKEEMKMVNESQKILGKRMDINATCVRVPVFNGHSVSMVVETEKEVDLERLKVAFMKHDTIIYFDHSVYPTPLDATGQDKVMVGRLRLDLNHKNKVLLWSVADNIRKGAASNAIQIAEYLVKEGIV